MLEMPQKIIFIYICIHLQDILPPHWICIIPFALMYFASTHMFLTQMIYLKCVFQSQTQIGWMGGGIGFVSGFFSTL